MKLLPKESIKDTNAIENYICKPLDDIKKIKKTPMSQEDAEIFGMLCLSSPIPLNEIKDSEKPFLCKLIEKRIEHCYTFRITDSRVILMLAQVSKVAGNAILYVTYLQYLCKKNNIKELSFNDFAKFFADGFFSNEDLSNIWTSQKVDFDSKSMASDNLIDYSTALKSIL